MPPSASMAWNSVQAASQRRSVSVSMAPDPEAGSATNQSRLSWASALKPEMMSEHQILAELYESTDQLDEGIREQRFLVLPHPEVTTYVQRKAADHDRWVGGMRRFRRRLMGGEE